MTDSRQHNNGPDMDNPLIQRYYDLLADQCTVGLDSDGYAEMVGVRQQLQREYSSHDWEADAEAIALSAAAVDQALAPPVSGSIPEAMADQILQALDEQSMPTEDVLDFAAQLAARKAEHKPDRTRWFGWYAAAAALAAAIYFGTERPVTVETLSPEQQVAGMLEQPETRVIAWGTPTESGYEQVTGDVIWNNQTQQGFMRLANMPVNNPGQSQYQLWIVDPERDENPVDGGVFDISSEGEVIIPIDSKLPIISPAAFAITREQPGGVVVSGGPLLVVAAVEA